MMKSIKTICIIGFIFCLICCEDQKPNQPPILLISASPSSGRGPLTVNFSAAGQDPEGKALIYAWDFGDGVGSSIEQNPIYTYTASGDFTATCTVTDSGTPPLSATATVAIEVLADTPTLSSVSPLSAVMHMPTFTLTANGSNFQDGARIVFNGILKDTTYVSSKKLTCSIEPDSTLIQTLLGQNTQYVPDIQVAFKVTVRNPGASGGESDPLDFMVHSNYSFEAPVQLPNGSGFYSPPSIVIRSDGQLNVIYRWGGSSTPFLDLECIRHTVSNDNGDSWTSDQQIISDLCPLDHPLYDPERILYAITAGQDKKIYVVYAGPPDPSEDSKKGDLYMMTSDGGSSWTKSCVTCSSASIVGVYNPSLHTCDEELYIFITAIIGDYSIGYHHIACLLDPEHISGGPNSPPPPLDSNESRIGVFTVDYLSRLHFAVYYKPWNETSYWIKHFSASKGLTSWSETHLISYPFGSYPSISLISDSNGTLYAFWAGTDWDGSTLSFSCSDNSGVTWTKRKMISGAGIYLYVSAAVDSAGNLTVVFSKENYGEEKVYFHRSIDGGLNWSAPKKVADPNGNSGNQALAVDNTGKLHVVWKTLDNYNHYSRSKINEN